MTTYNKYYLNCRFQIDNIEHENTVWIFLCKETAETVLDLMKKDGGHLGNNLFIEQIQA